MKKIRKVNSLISYRLNSRSSLNNNHKYLSILSFKIIAIFFLIFLSITNCFTFNLKEDNLPFSNDLLVNDSILFKITSFEQIHFQSCYKQRLDTSCGIATCASFLRLFYNINKNNFTTKGITDINDSDVTYSKAMAGIATAAALTMWALLLFISRF